jgi:hypothetical protein
VCCSSHTYIHLRRSEHIVWLNSTLCYAVCFLLPICGLLPIFDRAPETGYGTVAGVWCDVLIGTQLGEKWFIVNCVFTYSAIALMTAIFGAMLYSIQDHPEVVKNVLFGVGGYVLITIIIWTPRILLFNSDESRTTYLAIHLLPDVSALLYARLYFRRCEVLYKFEEEYAAAADREAAASADVHYDMSQFGSRDHSFSDTSMRTNSDGDYVMNPIRDKKLADLRQAYSNEGRISIQRGHSRQLDEESKEWVADAHEPNAVSAEATNPDVESGVVDRSSGTPGIDSKGLTQPL